MNRTKALSPKIIANTNSANTPPFNSNDCPLIAVDFSGLDPSKIVDVMSYANDVYENSEDFYIVEKLNKKEDGSYTSSHYNLNSNVSQYSKFLVTDYYKTEPLFYQYELMYDAYGSQENEIIRVYKDNSLLVDKNDYTVQYSYELLDSNDRYSLTDWSNVLDSTRKIHRIRVLFPRSYDNINHFYVIKYSKAVNLQKFDQEELVDLQPIYNTQDYTVNESNITLTIDTKITNTSDLYITKDPRDRIEVKGIDPQFSMDNVSSWKLRFNAGNIDIDDRFYYLDNTNVYEKPIAINNIKPKNVYGHIVQLSQYPINIKDTYVWPEYRIDTYDSQLESNDDEFGKLSITINGRTKHDIRVMSIDTSKGFIMLNKPLSIVDDIEFNLYVESSKYFLVDSIEFNPKISNYMVDYPDGIGFAIRPYNPDNIDGTKCLYTYDVSDPEPIRVCYPVISKGNDITLEPVNWVDDDFIALCEVNVNDLSKDFLDVMDARKIGGGIKKDIDIVKHGVNPIEHDWYVGRAHFGGAPLAHNGMIIINIPISKIDEERNKWISYYGDTEKGTKEFNFYLDQVIKRYISAGSEYIIIPIDSDGNFIDDILDLS